MRAKHREAHRSDRAGWLRASVLGANDGIVSVAGLVVGVAGLVAGAMSMAAGEYVSVQSQADTENSDLLKETKELADDPDIELAELAHIYVRRGLTPELANQVAEQLTAHDALGAHARDELGITDTLRARPIQAALASALAFTIGAAVPIAAVLLAPVERVGVVTIAVTIISLFLSGALAASAGGAPIVRGALRVGFWGAMAMAASHLIGNLFNVHV